MQTNQGDATEQSTTVAAFDKSPSHLGFRASTEPVRNRMEVSDLLPSGILRPVPSTFCKGHARFTAEEELHTFSLQGEIISLRHHPDVFPPSSFGLKFAEQIDFQGCDRAADVGTGTGLLAILAEKKGVREVKATDVSIRAVEIAEQNARLNGVRGLEVHCGDCFGRHTGSFDLITANLPQEIIPPAYRTTLSPLQSQAIDGRGVGGNQVLLSFLDIVSHYMHAQTRLYIIVNTITDYRQTLRHIDDRFHATLIWQGVVQTKTFVRENKEFFRRLIDTGKVSLVEDEAGDWFAQQFIYCLALKPDRFVRSRA